MPKKKITVVDIKDDENADIVDSNEVTTLEPIIEENNIETQDKPIVEEKPVEYKPAPDSLREQQDKPIVEEKIVRTNELIKCPKCLKSVTSKTLKYSHKKTCTGEVEANKPEPISKSKPIKQLAKIEEEVPPSPPKLVRTISTPIQHAPTPITQKPTPEMMREYRLQQRTEQLKMRSDRMSSLFTNSI